MEEYTNRKILACKALEDNFLLCLDLCATELFEDESFRSDSSETLVSAKFPSRLLFRYVIVVTIKAFNSNSFYPKTFHARNLVSEVTSSNKASTVYETFDVK